MFEFIRRWLRMELGGRIGRTTLVFENGKLVSETPCEQTMNPVFWKSSNKYAANLTGDENYWNAIMDAEEMLQEDYAAWQKFTGGK